MSTPALVIGAGINGLVTAHALARAGSPVLVLEANPPGDDAWPDAGAIDPRVLRDFGLDAAQLRIARPDPWLVVPLPDGGRLELSHDVAKTAAAIRRVSTRDAERWPSFCLRMHELGEVLLGLAMAPPPALMARERRELLRLARIGWNVRRRGRQAALDLLRILPMSIATLLDEWFENDALRAALGAAAVTHLHLGPHAGGTALVLLSHHAGLPAGVFRPPASHLRSALDAAAAGRFRIRYSARVERVRLTGGAVSGVTLESGEEIGGDVVASSLDARTTLLGLVGPDALEPEIIAAARAIRSRGVSASLTLELDAAPDFDTLLVARSIDEIERAHDDAKYGRASAVPWLEARSASPAAGARRGATHESGKGTARVYVHAQYAPHAPAAHAWPDVERDAFADRVVSRLREAVPGLPAITARTLRLPPDFERDLGWPQGQPYHAEPTLDQWLFMRPLPGFGHTTPIPNLFLCGPGTHPGLVPLGSAGMNAAGAILGRAG